PVIAGHEGAGVIEAVGPEVTELAPGDHVLTSFLPACGRCRWCVNGQSYLCDAGANAMTGVMADGTYRFRRDGEGVGAICCLGTFSQWATVSQHSVVKIAPDIPLDIACLVSCGVPTGWGSAVYAAGVRAQEVVVIYGVGGIGVNAVQGAVHAGAGLVIAVDPLETKLKFAESLGADEGFTSHDEMMRFLIDRTRGVLADKVIVTAGVVDDTIVQQAFDATRKGGTLALTGMSDGTVDRLTVKLSGTALSMWAKRVVGVIYGLCNPRYDMPALLELWREGKLKLDELISARYPLEGVNDGYADLLAGRNIRGVLEIAH
ncbi:MAG TPA: zinc-binding dehydrogenase, partial [Acidimicrobiales bacterium]|nr:zinc-binding dehydrogenase [Acidimicrobiales bacterium]